MVDNAKCVQEMCKHKIYTRTDFRKWALKNHPDKGGDSELFKYISNCVDEDRFCTESFCTPELFKLLNTKIEDNLRWIKDAQNDIKDSIKRLKMRRELQKQYKQFIKTKEYKDMMKTEWGWLHSWDEEYKNDQSRNINNLKESIKEQKEWIQEYKKDIKYYKETIQICNEVKQLIEKRKKHEEAEEARKKNQPILQLQDKPKPKKQRKPRERKPCKETHMRDPMTCKCIVDKTKKKCPSNKTLNPLTGRCLSNYDPSKKC